MFYSEHPCVCAFIAAFEKMLPDDRARAAGEMASFLIGYADGYHKTWKEALDIESDGLGLTDQGASNLVEMLNDHHVRPSEFMKKLGAMPPKGTT